ncbi:MAG: methionyl-tRNA formyltransferase, partial [Lachnospiraceae bacterium]|nr:methionyl-tRNA formyltransferase [Lachnospiraceae bacterium]
DMGRGKGKTHTPVYDLANTKGIPVFQPEKVNSKDSIDYMKGYAPDLLVVAAYGHILSREILELGKYGAINVHASLLPKYRGASPIQSAILEGERVTGVTIMRMDAGLDTGDILLQEEIEISPEETGGSLFERLSILGGSLASAAIGDIEGYEESAHKQDESQATFTRLIDKARGRVDFSKSASSIERMIRAFDPWPGAFSYLDGKMIKFWRAAAERDESVEAAHGTIISIDERGIGIAAGDGILFVKELQMEGRKRMGFSEFLRGKPLKAGMSF